MGRSPKGRKPTRGDLDPEGREDGLLEPLITRQPKPGDVEGEAPTPAPDLPDAPSAGAFIEPNIARIPKPDAPDLPEDPRTSQ